jgi:hypothetical protein
MKKTETWWSISKYRTNAVPLECIGSTPEMLICIGGRKVKKSTAWETYFPSREEAIEALRNWIANDVLIAKNALEDAKEKLVKFNFDNPAKETR